LLSTVASTLPRGGLDASLVQRLGGLVELRLQGLAVPTPGGVELDEGTILVLLDEVLEVRVREDVHLLSGRAGDDDGNEAESFHHLEGGDWSPEREFESKSWVKRNARNSPV
jgi:hypothetical protein